MAADAWVITITTNPTRLSPQPADPIAGSSIAIYNGSGATVYLGGPAVTAAAGFPLFAGVTITVDLTGQTFSSATPGVQTTVDEAIYGVAAADQAAVNVLATGI